MLTGSFSQFSDLVNTTQGTIEPTTKVLRVRYPALLYHTKSLENGFDMLRYNTLLVISDGAASPQERISWLPASAMKPLMKVLSLCIVVSARNDHVSRCLWTALPGTDEAVPELKSERFLAPDGLHKFGGYHRSRTP